MIHEILPVNNYQGNGESKTFQFNFYIDNENQLNVYLFQENGAKTKLINHLDYSINEIQNPNGSYITYPIKDSSHGILAENEKLSIELTLPIAQQTQYNNSSLLNLESLEYSLDYLTRLIQIISRKVTKCLKVEECSDLTLNELVDIINSNANSTSKDVIDVQNALKEYIKIKAELDETIEKLDFNDLRLNNPFFLGQNLYFEHEPNNSSWLKSEGQWNSKNIYPSCYDWILSQVNENKDGFKLNTATDITDYDFVINQEDETFRLPLLNGSENLPSTKYEDLDKSQVVSGANFTTEAMPANGYVFLRVLNLTGAKSMIRLQTATNCDFVTSPSSGNATAGVSIFVKKGEIVRVGAFGTFDSVDTFRFIYAKGNGSLYFYVGETIQSTSLIDVGKITEELSNKQDNCIHIIDTYKNGKSGYRIYSDGFCEQWGQATGSTNYLAANTINLLKEFKDTNYNVALAIDAGTNVLVTADLTSIRSTTAFGVKTGYNIETYVAYTFNWRACGYLKEGEY